MNIESIAVPEIYKSSSDFRFFMKWFQLALAEIQYDTDNFMDLLDPLRCKSELLWMLADTMGFRYDDRLPIAFNRLVLVYFMSMIRNKGSKDGVTLAAEVNLSQFSVELRAGKGYTDSEGNQVEPNEALYERLEDTSIPVNSAYVTAHTEQGYIDVVYFSEKIPVDACIEYVRPLGMYLFQYAGVRYDARSKISVDARLTDSQNLGMSIGPTHVGHYRREDYARMQRMYSEYNHEVNTEANRHGVYYRNSKYEGKPDPYINAGYRSLHSLQMANNAEISQSLLGPIFDLHYKPEDVSVESPKSAINAKYRWNLGYNQTADNMYDRPEDLYTVDTSRSQDRAHPKPAVNPGMMQVGDAISLNSENTRYTKATDSGIVIEDINTTD